MRQPDGARQSSAMISPAERRGLLAGAAMLAIAAWATVLGWGAVLVVSPPPHGLTTSIATTPAASAIQAGVIGDDPPTRTSAGAGTRSSAPAWRRSVGRS